MFFWLWLKAPCLIDFQPSTTSTRAKSLGVRCYRAGERARVFRSQRHCISRTAMQCLIDTYEKERKISYDSFPEEYQLVQLSYFQASGEGPCFGQLAWYVELHFHQNGISVEVFIFTCDSKFNLFHQKIYGEFLESAKVRYRTDIERVYRMKSMSRGSEKSHPRQPWNELRDGGCDVHNIFFQMISGTIEDRDCLLLSRAHENFKMVK